MIHALAILVLVSITPQEALERSHAASKREAKAICQTIEAELSCKFDGSEYATSFKASCSLTASHVISHFADHWIIRCERDREFKALWSLKLTPKVKPALKVRKSLDWPRDPEPEKEELYDVIPAGD